MKREDWRAALIACAVYNVHRGKDDRAIEPKDLLPWLAENREPARAQTPEEMRAILEQITLEMGGIVHPRNRPLSG